MDIWSSILNCVFELVKLAHVQVLPQWRLLFERLKNMETHERKGLNSTPAAYHEVEL